MPDKSENYLRNFVVNGDDLTDSPFNVSLDCVMLKFKKHRAQRKKNPLQMCVVKWKDHWFINDFAIINNGKDFEFCHSGSVNKRMIT